MHIRTWAALGSAVTSTAFAAIALLGASRGIGACASNGAAVDAGSNVWTIGVSNDLASFGVPLHNGWSVAESWINSRGGILGKKVQFIELDDQGDDNTEGDDGKVVIGVANQLIADDVAAVIGPNSSTSVLTVDQLFYKAQMLEISAAATSVDLSTAQPSMLDGGRFLFRTAPPDSLQGVVLALLANGGPPGTDAGTTAPTDAGGAASDAGAAGAGLFCPTLAVFYYPTAYGAPMEAILEQKYKGTIVARVQADSTVLADYSTQVNQVLAAKPACLAMIVYDQVADPFLLQMAKTLGMPDVSSFPFHVIGSDGVYDSELITNGRTDPSQTSSTSVVEGMYGTNPDTDPPGSPDYSFFANLYAAQFPLPVGQTDVDAYASNEFDAAMLIALAIAQAGGVSDRVKLRDSLVAISSGQGASHGASDLVAALRDIASGTKITYSGASGPCVLDPNGDVVAGYIFWQVQSGNLVTLAHVPASALAP